MLKLWPFQARAITKIIPLLRSKKRVVLVSPTGSGKTVIASRIIHTYIKHHKRVLFIAHRMELIEQCCQKLKDNGVSFGVICGNLPHLNNPNATVQVASISALSVRKVFPQADLVVIDECHRTAAKSYVRLLENYPKASVLGLTATPWRTDGEGLDKFYTSMIVAIKTHNAVRNKYLTNPFIWSSYIPDLTKVQIVRGDYSVTETNHIMNRKVLIGNVVDHWMKRARYKRTVVFACSLRHSRRIVKRFLNKGIKAVHLDYRTTANRRREILKNLVIGKINVVCNVNMLTEGWDLPNLECVILARPTRSSILYLQMAGRVMRSSVGKGRPIIFDHAGCSIEHNLPIYDRTFTLEGVDNIEIQNAGTSLNKVCPACTAVVPLATMTCPECGYVFEKIVEVNQDLQRLTSQSPCRVCGRYTLKMTRSEQFLQFGVKFKCDSCQSIAWTTISTVRKASSREIQQDRKAMVYYLTNNGVNRNIAEEIFNRTYKLAA